MRILRHAVVIAALAVSGCAALQMPSGSDFRQGHLWGPLTRLMAPGTPAAQAYAEEGACLREHARVVNGTTMTDDQAVRACLVAKGWRDTTPEVARAWRTAVADSVEKPRP